MPATKYRIPESGDVVALDAKPLNVGLHDIAERGDVFRVVGREISDSGLHVKVRPDGTPDGGPTFRLGFQHVRPAGEDVVSQ